jgi:glycine cleavage system aminomethyltransferase T
VSPIVDHPRILLYSRIRKSPFFYASRRHGVAMYSVYNHMYHPRHYGDPVEEYWQLLRGVTLWDVGVERQVEISGPDAFAFTNMLVARDLAKCEVGQCKYVFVTAPDGGIINDPVLLRLDEDRFWLSLADSDVLLWALGFAHGLRMDVTIREVDVGPLQIQGPRSGAVMADLFGPDVLEVPYYFLRRYELDGMQVLVSRTGYTSELGYEIYVLDASRHAERAWEAVLEAGRPHELAVTGPCHIRRIEGGMLAYGADMGLDTNPYEVGMGYDWMVDLEQKDDFVGKQALERIKREGVRRRLAGVEISGAGLGAYSDGAMVDFFGVRHRGEDVGRVTSACHSPRLEKNIGYAMVPIELAELGTQLEIDVAGDRRDAVVVEMPFIDPEKEIAKQQLARPG